jgi:hypothetical protein
MIQKETQKQQQLQQLQQKQEPQHSRVNQQGKNREEINKLKL